jgi:nucleoside-diphosphate-sugar epimerase
MMYMDDAIRGTIQLMEAPAENITIRTSYNFTAISFTPAELVAEIRKISPDFEIIYNPDDRQKMLKAGHKRSMIRKREKIGAGKKNMICQR